VTVLDLKSPRWVELKHAYGPAGDVPGLLRRLESEGADSEVWTEVWSALCHQYSVYTATYAAVPHVVAIAKAMPPARRLMHLCFVGTVAACAHLPGAHPIPGDLRPAYEEALRTVTALILESLAGHWDEADLRHLMASLAGVKGHPALGFVLGGIDCSIECPECGALFEAMESNLNLLWSHNPGTA
jgi:hypothetical protein